MRSRISALLSILALFSLLLGCGGGGSGGSGGGAGTVVNSSGASSSPPLVNSGSVTLYWDEVNQNTDNSVINDLSEYVIYYDTESRGANEPYSYSASLNVSALPDPSEPSSVISNLTPGTWYFRVTAKNVIGNESEKSDEISVTVL